MLTGCLSHSEKQVPILKEPRGSKEAVDVDCSACCRGKLICKSTAHKSRIADIARELTGAELLDRTGKPRIGISRLGPTLHALRRSIIADLFSLNPQPLKNGNILGIGEQINPYRGDTCAEPICTLVLHCQDALGFTRVLRNKRSHLSLAARFPKAHREMVTKAHMLV